MKMKTTMGKYRRLTRCSSAAGHFHILAIDHRGNLRGRMARGGRPIDDRGFRDFKQDVLRALLPEATAVLADPAIWLRPRLRGAQYPRWRRRFIAAGSYRL